MTRALPSLLPLPSCPSLSEQRFPWGLFGFIPFTWKCHETWRVYIMGQAMLSPETRSVCALGRREMMFKGVNRSQQPTNIWESGNPVICAMKRDYSPSVPARVQRNSEWLVPSSSSPPAPCLAKYLRPVYITMALTCWHNLPLRCCCSPHKGPGTALGTPHIIWNHLLNSGVTQAFPMVQSESVLMGAECSGTKIYLPA